jgi:hypothetical protein
MHKQQLLVVVVEVEVEEEEEEEPIPGRERRTPGPLVRVSASQLPPTSSLLRSV